ncbi:MAG: efflux RND transporter periplasmic adaptor subunit [Betaproteobacteria bacterium]|nr:MAG: efflux RND transporter periplasmic adaptor subunit [Betaproteobacteria bacterium]
MTRRATWWTIVGVLGLALVIGLSVYSAFRRKAQEESSKKTERPALEFAANDVVQLRPHRLAYQLTLPGTVQAISQTTVRAKVAAELKRVNVREGERVAAGQILAEFDAAQIRAQLAERTGALESARAQLRMTQRTRQTNAQLVKQNFISQNAFDSADSANDAQVAAVAVAQAQLEQTQIMLGDAVVRAPISGVIAKRLVQPGEKVGFDAPLLAIVDLSQLEVQAQAAVADIFRIRTGMPAEVLVEGAGSGKVSGRVERINPSAELGTRTINVYVSIHDEDARLKTGMFARVVLTIAPQSDVPALPVAALRGDEGEQYVWVIAAGKLAKRSITVGARDDRAQLIEIASGLGPDDVVLASKFDNLKDGLAAKVIAAQAGAGATAGVAARSN